MDGINKVLQAWLVHQCRMLPGSKQAVLLTGPLDVGPYNRALSWPSEGHDHSVLSHVAKAALRNKKAVVKTRNSQVPKTGEPLDAVACPLF